jgi:hypothetical protein
LTAAADDDGRRRETRERGMDAKKPSKELLGLLADHDPAVVRLALALRSLVLELAPDANETVYDASYTVSDIFSFTDRWQDSFCMVATYRRHANLVFTHGARLADPGRRLRGSGKQLRHLQVRTEADLQNSDLRDFLHAAIAKARQDIQGPGDADTLP